MPACSTAEARIISMFCLVCFCAPVRHINDVIMGVADQYREITIYTGTRAPGNVAAASSCTE